MATAAFRCAPPLLVIDRARLSGDRRRGPRYRLKRGFTPTCTSRRKTPSTCPFSHGAATAGSEQGTPEPGANLAAASASFFRRAANEPFGSGTTHGVGHRPGTRGWPTNPPLARPDDRTAKGAWASAEKLKMLPVSS